MKSGGWKQRFLGWMGLAPPDINERAALGDIESAQPGFLDFLSRRFQTQVEPHQQRLSLENFALLNHLPPAQVIYVEWQLAQRPSPVQRVSAAEAAHRLTQKKVRILDAREPCEWKHGSLPEAVPVDAALWDQLGQWAPDTPLVVYCHFGIRSLDVAQQLFERGFTDVSVIQGGIDAWSVEVDPNLPRYEGSWC